MKRLLFLSTFIVVPIFGAGCNVLSGGGVKYTCDSISFTVLKGSLCNYFQANDMCAPFPNVTNIPIKSDIQNLSISGSRSLISVMNPIKAIIDANKNICKAKRCTKGYLDNLVQPFKTYVKQIQAFALKEAIYTINNAPGVKFWVDDSDILHTQFYDANNKWVHGYSKQIDPKKTLTIKEILEGFTDKTKQYLSQYEMFEFLG